MVLEGVHLGEVAMHDDLGPARPTGAHRRRRAHKFTGYRLIDQWISHGLNVFSLPDGHDYDQIVGALKTMEEWDPADRRPMIAIGTTTKGHWPGAVHDCLILVDRLRSGTSPKSTPSCEACRGEFRRQL